MKNLNKDRHAFHIITMEFVNDAFYQVNVWQLMLLTKNLQFRKMESLDRSRK